VAKNVATRYEAWLIVTDGTNTYVNTSQFTITASPFDTNGNATDVHEICGNVIQIKVTPKYNFNLTSTGKTFYLDFAAAGITVTATGVAVGGTYPAYKVAYSGSIKLADGKLYTDDITSLSTAAALEFYTAAPVGGPPSLDISYHYKDDSYRSDTSFVIFSSSSVAGSAVNGPTAKDLNTAIAVPVQSAGTQIVGADEADT
jgi:hypothetical protein